MLDFAVPRIYTLLMHSENQALSQEVSTMKILLYTFLILYSVGALIVRALLNN